MRLIGVDVGGTFTDVVFADTDSNQTAVHKVATTPDDPSEGVMQGISGLCQRDDIDPASIDHVFHGTTIATNAILEYKGARTGLITTQGYRDILHIGRHQRPEHYSIMQEIPWQNRQLIRRRYRKVVQERLIPPNGDVLTPLDEDGVRRAVGELKAEGVDSIAICFLFSYLDPAHEDRALAIVREQHPEAFVTTSASVSPQFREFERFTTAALNAFVGPTVRNYITNLEAGLKKAGVGGDLRIMRSNGGVATAAMVSDNPVYTLMSGPAAGVLGGAWTGELSRRKNLITFDVGGTSADIGLVTNGGFSEATARDTWIAGFPVMVPMIDIHSIGAGGGSVAYVDRAGAFKVGPRSAGAVPGPAAYGRGGTEPTVTDANLVLGRLDRANFLGGDMKLDESAARRAVGDLSKQVGMSETETAEGILTILNSNMANAIRTRTVQKGIDPRDYTLAAFGGAGPLHGAEVAAMLSIPEVIIPTYPGITSALGLLTTDLKYDAIRTAFQISGKVDLARLNRGFQDMEAGLYAQFAEDGVPRDQISLSRFGDLRYVGQGYELRASFPVGAFDEAELEETWQEFHALHEAEYGHFFADSPIEIVNIRVAGIGVTPKMGKPGAVAGGSLADAHIRDGRCVFRHEGNLEEFDTAFFRREALPTGQPIDGPAIILQADSTTVVPPGSTLTAEQNGNLIIRLAAAQDAGSEGGPT